MDNSPAPSRRLVSIDAYRGLVMFLLFAELLRFGAMSKALPDSGLWKFLALHQSHVEWVGCTLHDLIQPSFSFLVGVSLAFSVAARATVQSPVRMTLHAFWRAFALVALGIFLRSKNASQTNYTFEDTLTQIGLGYGFLYLLARASAKVQWLAFGLILAGYWLLFAAYPLPGEGFDWAKAGVTPDWPDNLKGFAAHWNKNTNPAWAFDVWFLNLFPREKPFLFNVGGYATLSFIPTLATMILGLIAGRVLQGGRTAMGKLGWLFVAGLAGVGAGWLLDALGVCPLVKRIWTPSWALYSGGWCCLLLAFFQGICETLNYRGWAFPLVVLGANAIAAYVMDGLISSWIGNAWKRHLGVETFRVLGREYESLLLGGATMLTLWLILFWMYRKRIFVKI